MHGYFHRNLLVNHQALEFAVYTARMLLRINNEVGGNKWGR